jgi:hydrogenase/urease accessory protein HupE
MKLERNASFSLGKRRFLLFRCAAVGEEFTTRSKFSLYVAGFSMTWILLTG